MPESEPRLGDPSSFIRTGDGSFTLFSRRYHESYHSLSGAKEESEARYIRGSGLDSLLRRGSVLFVDVGFGLGWNAAAALKSSAGRELHLLSLEKDLDVLPRAGSFPVEERYRHAFSLVRQMADCPNEVLRIPGGGTARIVTGDARESLRELSLPETDFAVIAHDPFSPRHNPELWTSDFFRQLAVRLQVPAILCTYSAAIAVRLNLLRAGWRIGLGGAVGAKSSGTVASFHSAMALPRFSAKKAQKIRRRFFKETGERLDPWRVA